MYDITECPMCLVEANRNEIKECIDRNIRENPITDMDEKRELVLHCLCFNSVRVKIKFDYYYTYETVK